MVLEGGAIAEIGGMLYPLQAGDTTWVPANVPPRFINASHRAPMRIFWTYASVDATRTLAATGETRPVGAEHGRQGP